MVVLILLLLLLAQEELISVDGGDVVGEVGLAEASVATQVAEGDACQGSELGDDQLTVKRAVIQSV